MAVELTADEVTEDNWLVERWQARQRQLADLLEGHGAADSERRVDWEAGCIEWVEPGGLVRATAEMRALCSYSFDDESLMMAWANEGLEQNAVIESMPDVPDMIEDCSETDAWMWAMRLAEEAQADFLYRIASPSYLVFLGLWQVVPAITEEEIEEGSPQSFVLELLDSLRTAVKEQASNPTSLRRLFINQGESLNHSAQSLYSDRSDAGLLRRTGDTLIEIGRSLGQRRFGLLPPAHLTEEEVGEITRKVSRLRAAWIR
jgi:hypothetical protein